jgi:hypothetical protein
MIAEERLSDISDPDPFHTNISLQRKSSWTKATTNGIYGDESNPTNYRALLSPVRAF